ncbi:MAG TPA: lipid kinase YegS [Pseudoxanthomonas sp.]|nr:lipid kinase YegS [Pseudoxanthomonas sp.]
MSPTRWCLILNGKSADNEDLRAAVADMRARGVDLQVRVTWESGDAERYTREAFDGGVEAIIAAGGDGTLSSIASALAGYPRSAAQLPSLALVPLGTANDFACATGVPLEPLAALELAIGTTPAPVDLLRIECDGRVHWCANLASGGFGTQVTVETDAGMKKMLGGLAYLITGIARLGRIEPVRARLHGPGFDWEGDFIALGLGNGRLAGGGQALCPDALLDDGLLDLTVVPELSGEVGATVAALLGGGKQAALDRVAVRARLPWLQIESPRPMTLNLDGEPLESQRFRIDCVPGRLRMHLPADCTLRGARQAAPEEKQAGTR